jgi:hypothetical protein
MRSQIVTARIVGALSEVTLAVAVVTIAVLLFPVLKPGHEGMALGYVGIRILEGAIILTGALTSLLLLTLSQELITAEASDLAGLRNSGAVLLEARDWTDSLGQMIVFSLSALILYHLLYQSRLVPRFLSIWGFIGGITLLIAGIDLVRRECHIDDHDPAHRSNWYQRDGPCCVEDREGIPDLRNDTRAQRDGDLR